MKRTKAIQILASSALAATLLLASCHSNREITAPEADTQALYRGQDTASADSATIADIPWSSYFADSYLQSLIDEGIKNNYDMQIAQMRQRHHLIKIT